MLYCFLLPLIFNFFSLYIIDFIHSLTIACLSLNSQPWKTTNNHNLVLSSSQILLLNPQQWFGIWHLHLLSLACLQNHCLLQRTLTLARHAIGIDRLFHHPLQQTLTLVHLATFQSFIASTRIQVEDARIFSASNVWKQGRETKAQTKEQERIVNEKEVVSDTSQSVNIHCFQNPSHATSLR